MATKKPAPKPKRKSAPKSALKSAPQRGPEGRRKTRRPSLVDDLPVLERARLAYQIGMTDQEVAKLIGVTPTTLYDWAIKSPTFFEALKSGKALADNRVEQSLYQRALGHTYRAEKAFCHQGAIVKTHVDEHVPPDVAAQILPMRRHCGSCRASGGPMSRFLHTRGCARLAIGVCDRCHFKAPLDDLRPDGDRPGLRMCAPCCDQIDPWRLRPPKPEAFVIGDPSSDRILLPEEKP